MTISPHGKDAQGELVGGSHPCAVPMEQGVSLNQNTSTDPKLINQTSQSPAELVTEQETTKNPAIDAEQTEPMVQTTSMKQEASADQLPKPPSEILQTTSPTPLVNATRVEFPQPPKDRTIFALRQRRRKTQLSLTVRMVGVIVTLLIAGLIVAGATILGILQAQLVGQVESEITEAAQRVAATIPDNDEIRDTNTLPSNYYVRIDRYGFNTQHWISLIGQSETGIPEVNNFLDRAPMTPSGVTQPITVESNTGAKWQAVAALIVDDGTAIGYVVVAQPLLPVQMTIHNTAVYLLICGILLTIIGGVSAFYLVRYSLRPLREIEAVAGQIAEGDLSQRIDDKPRDTEVGSLAKSLNKMLSRIERAFSLQKNSEDQMRRFISDASHELRTPLAAIQGYGELYSMGGVPQERIPDVMDRISSEAKRMGVLVEDLLKLVRLDEGRQKILSPTNIANIVRNSAMDLIALSPTRDVHLCGLEGEDFPKKLWTLADSNQLSQMLTNLIGNIDRYTPKDSPVEIFLGIISVDTSSKKMIHLQVQDHGPGVKQEAIGRLFERFFREDTSRSRETGGTGLGLSIVDAVAKAHHGEARASETPGGGLTVTIEIEYVEVQEDNEQTVEPENQTQETPLEELVPAETESRFKRLFRSEKSREASKRD